MQRFHGICLLDVETGNTITLVARANTEAEASRQLHATYNIEAVLDILTEEQAKKRRNTRKKSLYTSSLKH